MKPEKLKAVIEKSGRLQFEYVERNANDNFDGIYVAVLDAHSVLQTPYLVPLKRDFLESKSPEEVAVLGLLFDCHIRPIYRLFGSAPGRIRTCDPRIRSPNRQVLACPNSSENSAYLS